MLPPPTGPPVSIVKSKGVSLALEILAKALKYYFFSASFLDYNLEKNPGGLCCDGSFNTCTGKKEKIQNKEVRLI